MTVTPVAQLPYSYVTSLCFGGKDRKTLFVTVGSIQLDVFSGSVTGQQQPGATLFAVEYLGKGIEYPRALVH